MKTMLESYRNRFFLATAVPLVILLAMMITPVMTLLWGKEIVLETRPVDPTDLFRGDYVILSYKIENVDIDKIPSDLKNEYKNYTYVRNRQVQKDLYASLKEVNGYYEVDKLTYDKPADGMYLKCKLRYIGDVWDGTNSADWNNVSSHNKKVAVVDYSIDKYFVSEGTGGELESMSRKGDLAAKLKVYKGYGLVEGVTQK